MLETWPAVFGVQFTGGRWLSVVPSRAARGTFGRKELRVVDGVFGRQRRRRRPGDARTVLQFRDQIWNFNASATR